MTAVLDTNSGAEPRNDTKLVRRILRRPLAVVSLAYIVCVGAAAVTATWLSPYDPTSTDLRSVLSGPTGDHLLGTDALGRDLLSRIMHGGQISLLGVIQAVLTVVLLGVPVGLVAGYFGGWLDRLTTWAVDVMLAIPVVVTLLVVVAVFGHNQAAVMVTLGILGAPGVARVVRSATLAVRQELYIDAAKVSGLPDRHIIVKHVLPRATGPIVVQTSIFAGVALLAETGLGYLGLGVPPPTPTWGGLVADASAAIDRQPWMLIPTGLVIALTILAFGLIGDAVRDASAHKSSRTSRRPVPGPRPSLSEAVARAESPLAPSALLTLRGLSITVPTAAGPTTVVEHLDLDIHPGETVGLVGESGCGKSITGRAILGLLPAGGHITAGSVRFNDTELTTLGQPEMRGIRGSGIAVVSQEPVAGLDPAFTVGHQLDELVRRHDGGSRKRIRARTVELLESVKLPHPAQVASNYPHELSGGMAQRVAIAMALSGRPKLVIADEPTTALDVTVQAEILDLLRMLQRDSGMSVLLITHDWAVVADICQRAYVMYAGHVMESAAVTTMFESPLHPYTSGLLGCAPRRVHPGERLPMIEGTVPNPSDWPAGCHFEQRCPLATAQCANAPVPLFEPSPTHRTRCIHFAKLQNGGDHAPERTPARRP